jgi:hypothetical protein
MTDTAYTDDDSNKVKLQLGDIVQLNAPNDSDINEHIYHIIYIDENKIRLEEADGSEQILTLTDGSLDNEAIESIRIKSRAEETGYAKQNNLMNGVWIDIYFSGDLPLTLTGKITNLEEDRIEVTTFPENEVIFIDFQYKGLPEDLPIEKIQIRKAPDVSITAKEQAQAQAQEPAQEPAQALGEEPSSTEALEKRYKEIQRQLLEIPEDERTDENLEFEEQQKIKEQTRNYIFNADQLQFGEDLEAITQLVDVPEEEQRYDIDKQLDDLLDDMLSTIPTAKRTDSVKNDLHKMIVRFKQLRENFSVFDKKGYVSMPKIHGLNYKPLVGIMERLETQLYWMLPVVKNIKKLYNNEEEEEGLVEMGSDDAQLINFNEDASAEKKVVENYEENNEIEGNKYALLQKKLNPYLTPFLEPNEKEEVLSEVQVNTAITAVVDNLVNFNSSVQGTDTFTSPHSTNKYERNRKIHQKRFALQNYTLGSSGLEITKVRGDNPIIKRKELTKNDTLYLKSIMTLPEPAVRFSRINLYTPSILDKSNLNLHFLNYWQLLKESTHVSTTVIMDMTKPHEHNVDTFLKHVRNYAVNEIKAGADTGTDTDTDTYNKYLNTIIPKTKFFFNLIKPYLTGKLSIHDILTYLEPFMIYQEDLNVNQYKEMNDYIRERILEYRKQYASKSREYTNLKGTQNVILPSLIKLLDENANLRTKVLDVYGFSNTIMSMSNADFIKRIYDIDSGVFYNNAIAYISTNLMIADGTRDMVDIDMYLNKEKAAAATATATAKSKTATAKTKKTAIAVGGAGEEEIINQSNCNKFKTIAKRYIELDELNEDNGTEVYFDKKYDSTDYSIGELFKADASMTTKEQIQHYISKLIKNKGLDEVSARRDAEAIVKGKRLVENGEYALLETTNETSATLQYYVRQNENWVLDESIDSETFADDMKMFCNLNEKCIAVKDNCEDQTTGANELKKHNLKLILAEFNTVLNVNKDIITNKIEDELGSADARIEVLRNLRITKLYKYDMKKIEIGNTAEETKKMVASPYDGLLNTILGQVDTAKRYLDISNFVKSFTREGLPENDESHYWLYCVKSGKKMLPTFIAQLAATFLTGGNFALMLDKICALQGTLSDDGDKYVDKYSGYTIKMIEMSSDEEYNEEGFKIVTRAVIESDVGDMLAEALKTLPPGIKPAAIKRKYATPDATAIYNVIEALSSNMGLNIADQKEFIVMNVMKQLSNTSVMSTKTAYEKFYTQKIAAGKTMDTYEVAYNSMLMYLTLSYFLVAIQTSIPPIKTKTTFPGCKKSFSGFPIESDTTNTKGLTYVSCVAFKIRNKTALPWSAIANRPDTFIAKQMEVILTKYILPTEEVQSAIKTLSLYLVENPESTHIPVEHRVENWTNFLPPLKQLKMITTQDVGDVFKGRLSDSLRKGQKVQDDYIAELQSKMILFSFNIIDLIEKTVHGEQAILRGKNGEPYVENACCDVGENNTIKYFVKKQPEIAILNNKVVRLSDMFDDTKKLSKAVLLYDPSNTKRKLREIENKFSEQTIYRAFIVYCKFNSLVPLSENLKAICPTKPDNFDLNDTLEESIRKLKSNARNYNEQSLQQLLSVINNTTKAPLRKEEKDVTNVSKLAEIMTEMDAENKRPSAFRQDFMNVLETFEMNALLTDTAEMRKFKNLLSKLNDDMLEQINNFVSNFNANVKKTNFTDFKTCLKTVLHFKETGNNLILQQKEETGYKMINFMKKTMRALTCEFPNIIMNEVKNDNVTIPEHWELSAIHVLDVKNIVKGHYSEFTAFYKDAQIRLLMRKMIEMTGDINALAQNTLCYAPVELRTKEKQTQAQTQSQTQAQTQAQTQSQTASPKEKTTSFKYSAFDLELTTLLFNFYFLNVLTDLISLQTDKELLGLPLQQLEEESSSDSFMTQAYEQDILVGNQTELAEKIATLIVSFTNLICKDKSVIDYNYKSLMDLVLRSKEKEKDEITDYLGKMTVEERAVEDLFKSNKLGRWSKGEQKGLHSYDAKTFDEERAEIEKIATRESRLNKRSVVTDMNREIFQLDMLDEEAANQAQDQEDNTITYMGEDAEPEDYDMDGDENY